MWPKKKGFALVQALFFMLFIMAIISFTMILTANRSVGITGERMAADAYPAVAALVHYTLDPTSKPCDQDNYFLCYPVAYSQKTTLSDPNANLTIKLA